MLKTLIYVVLFMTLLGMVTAVEELRQVSYQEARINEYEFQLADYHRAFENCKNQLGVFYNDKEVKWNKK